MNSQPKHTFSSANLVRFSLALAAPSAAAAHQGWHRPNLLVERPAPILRGPAQTSVDRRSDFMHELANRSLRQKILAYRRLQNGWDGPNSVPPSTQAVNAALSFLDSFSAGVPLPEVTVAGDGEISMSWRDERKFVDVSFYGEVATAYSRVGEEIQKLPSVTQFFELPTRAIEELLSS